MQFERAVEGCSVGGAIYRVDRLDPYCSMVLLFVPTLIYRDVAPFWFYLVSLIAGIALLAR